jgi:hypothetical protein
MMSLRLYDVENTGRLYFTIAVLIGILALGVFQCMHEFVFAFSWKYPDEKEISFIFASLVLPFAAIVGVLRRKIWGVQAIAAYLVIALISLLMSVWFWGPSMSFPKAWWIIGPVLLVTFLVRQELWTALWINLSARTRTIYLKMVQAGFVALLSVAPIYALVTLVRGGSPYPALEAPRGHALSVSATDSGIPLPYPFQFELPSEAKMLRILKNRTLVLIVRGKPFFISPENDFKAVIGEFSAKSVSVKDFMRERFGAIPTLLKSIALGDHPDQFVELSATGLWGVATVNDQQHGASLRVLLWTDQELPLGEIRTTVSSTEAKSWDWIYSIHSNRETPWPVQRYLEQAELAKINKNYFPEGICRAFAAVSDPGNVSLMRDFILYLGRTQGSAAAKSQLKESLLAYPNSPLLSDIHLQ